MLIDFDSLTVDAVRMQLREAELVVNRFQLTAPQFRGRLRGAAPVLRRGGGGPRRRIVAPGIRRRLAGRAPG